MDLLEIRRVLDTIESTDSAPVSIEDVIDFADSAEGNMLNFIIQLAYDLGVHEGAGNSYC